MNAEQLYAAAEKLDRVAAEREQWARNATKQSDRDLFGQVAQQFRDRAAQTRSWANNAAHYAQQGQAVPAGVTQQIEQAVREFLRMAGSVDGA